LCAISIRVRASRANHNIFSSFAWKNASTLSDFVAVKYLGQKNKTGSHRINVTADVYS
jgi:hypothetical protein